MHKDSTAVDILQAFVHAHVMATLTDKNSSVHTESQSWMDGKYEVFLQKVFCSWYWTCIFNNLTVKIEFKHLHEEKISLPKATLSNMSIVENPLPS